MVDVEGIEAEREFVVLLEPLVAVEGDFDVPADHDWFFEVLGLGLLVVVLLANAHLQWLIEVEVVHPQLLLNGVRVHFLELVISGLTHDLHVPTITLTTGMNRFSGWITSDSKILMGGCSTFTLL